MPNTRNPSTQCLCPFHSPRGQPGFLPWALDIAVMLRHIHRGLGNSISFCCVLPKVPFSHTQKAACGTLSFYLTVDSRDHSPVVWGTLPGVGLLSSSQQVSGDGCLSCPQSWASKNNAAVNNIVLCCVDFLKVSLRGRFLEGIALDCINTLDCN